LALAHAATTLIDPGTVPLLLITALTALVTLSAAALPNEALAVKSFDVKLDDRVDPVAPGDEMVFEIDVIIRGQQTVPDVAVTLTTSSALSFVEARRGPTWEVIPADVQGQSVTFELGPEEPCNDKELPPCREISAVFQVDAGTTPGSVLETGVSMTSSDPGSPTDSAVIYTSVGSLALRNGRMPVDAGVVRLRAHIGRTGMHSPLDPPPPNIDLSQGLRIRFGEVGQAPVFDLLLPADALECDVRPDPRLPTRCRLVDNRAWRPLGLLRFRLYKNGDFAQLNNAVLRVTLDDLGTAVGFGPDLELTLDANGVTYTDSATFVQKDGGRLLFYDHDQFEP
jgi:hypothetical protein